MTLTLENSLKETSPITNEKLVVGYKISELGMIPEDGMLHKESDKKWQFILDRTIFYPRGGRQSTDQGTIFTDS